MTREKAINLVMKVFDTLEGECNIEYDWREEHEARDMAIKALEQEPCEDAISRADAIRVASGYCHPANIAGELAKLPPVKPVQRWIPVSERLPEENGFHLATCDGEICVENEPFTGLAEYENGKWVYDEEDYQCVLAWMPLPKPYIAMVVNEPPVKPARKKGKWIKSNIGGAKVCSICQAHMGLSNFNYCPNCGAKMGSEEE